VLILFLKRIKFFIMATKKKAKKVGATKKTAPKKRSYKKTSVVKHTMKKRRRIKGIGEQMTEMLMPTAQVLAGVLAGRFIIKNIPNKGDTDARPYIVAAAGLGLAVAVPKAKFVGMGISALGASRIIPESVIPKVINGTGPKALGKGPKALGKASTVKILSTRKVAGTKKMLGSGGNYQQGTQSVIMSGTSRYNHTIH
jgi:hypothetical protein